MITDETFTYAIVHRSGRWMIEVTDETGETNFMTCGINPTKAEVWARVRMLRLDDDGIDASHGQPRNYQS